MLICQQKCKPPVITSDDLHSSEVVVYLVRERCLMIGATYRIYESHTSTYIGIDKSKILDSPRTNILQCRPAMKRVISYDYH